MARSPSSSDALRSCRSRRLDTIPLMLVGVKGLSISSVDSGLLLKKVRQKSRPIKSAPSPHPGRCQEEMRYETGEWERTVSADHSALKMSKLMRGGTTYAPEEQGRRRSWHETGEHCVRAPFPPPCTHAMPAESTAARRYLYNASKEPYYSTRAILLNQEFFIISRREQ